MKISLAATVVFTVVFALPIASFAQSPSPGPELIVTRTTVSTPDQVVDAIQAYAESKKWLYLGASKAKNGEVTMVKVCIPDVGKILWPVGLQISALLPCGNLGVYQSKGKTEISMLHPAYMEILYPHPAVSKASQMATPLLLELLSAVAQ